MRNFRLFQVDLGRLILALALMSALVAFGNTLYASYRLQRAMLIDSTLEAHRVYAAKLAESTQHFLISAQKQLAYCASTITSLDDEAELTAAVTRLHRQSDSFNSVILLDAQGVVRAQAPLDLDLRGTRLADPGSPDRPSDLPAQKPTISHAYLSRTGRLLISLSHPLRDASGAFLGTVAGTIYLSQSSILSNLLGKHYYRDGSYLYVVDEDGRLLYHVDPKRIGEVVRGNPVIEAVRRGESGAQYVVNTRGQEMLAGYAPIPLSRWGVVAQRPLAATLEPLDGLMWSLLLSILPVAVASIIAIWWLAGLIAKPLRQLANNVEHSDPRIAAERVQAMQPRYFEADRLKRAVLASLNQWQERMGKLNLAMLSDPMTGLSNRRGLQLAMDQWQTAGQSFAIIAIDIDRFKSINDTYGHVAGDHVLQHVAQFMKDGSRENDLLCRYGGDEFLMLLPGLNDEAARQIAERLRARVADNAIPGIGNVTVSLGVSEWRAGEGESQQEALNRADKALYAAKQGGRNRVACSATRRGAHPSLASEQE